MWICPKCKSENDDLYAQCQECHTSRPASSSHVQESGGAQELEMNRLLKKVRNAVICAFIAAILNALSAYGESLMIMNNHDDGWLLCFLLDIIAACLWVYVASVAIDIIIDWIKTRHKILNNARAIREMLENQK